MAIVRLHTLLLVLVALSGSPAARADFLDWWLTADQQGRIAYTDGDFARAAQLFSEPRWKALAFYASGDFASAAVYFEQLDSAFGAFYLGNALAHQGQLPGAIDAYQRALALDPTMEAASFNLEWVSGLAELDNQQYEDAGGTGGKLGADRIVFDDRAKEAKQTMNAEQASREGLSDEQIEAIWMRRVQTTPEEFLGLKFSYQLRERSP